MFIPTRSSVLDQGSLGGVHRGGERCMYLIQKYVILLTTLAIAMDVSPDLVELSKSPVGLVSAGVKSILDIGR